MGNPDNRRKWLQQGLDFLLEFKWFIVLLFFKFLVCDVMKVPTGSMEPTLAGHPDHGDRIFVNELAYEPIWKVIVVLATFLLLLGGAWLHGRTRREWRLRFSIPVLAAIVLTIGFCAAHSSFADEPQRFDIAVFTHESAWDNPNEPNAKINYVKRVAGLPGETVCISGGDLFRLNPTTEKYEILRKADRPDLQDALWQPVSKAWPQTFHTQLSSADRARLDFPWTGAEPGTAGVTLGARSVELDGSAPVTLTYAYPVTNLMVKPGRWPFQHINCPAGNSPGMTACVTATCDGIQCPRCHALMFPATTTPIAGAALKPLETSETGSYFCGGDSVVGDLKLEVALLVENAGGAVRLDVGSDLHCASWEIPSTEVRADTAIVHPVTAATAALTPGKHALSLAYVDATVIALLDGKEIERRAINVEPPGKLADHLQSLARITLSGVRGTITRLELARDLYYLPMVSNYRTNPNAGISEREHNKRFFEDGMMVLQIPQEEYLMLGDNSPSSADGRIWGFVPRDHFSGRASAILWPPSRWGVLH